MNTFCHQAAFQHFKRGDDCQAFEAVQSYFVHEAEIGCLATGLSRTKKHRVGLLEDLTLLY